MSTTTTEQDLLQRAHDGMRDWLDAYAKAQKPQDLATFNPRVRLTPFYLNIDGSRIPVAHERWVITLDTQGGPMTKDDVMALLLTTDGVEKSTGLPVRLCDASEAPSRIWSDANAVEPKPTRTIVYIIGNVGAPLTADVPAEFAPLRHAIDAAISAWAAAQP